jgi:hypothetical protein
MTTFNCADEMTGYHNEEVTLCKADQDEMRRRRDAGRTRLTKGLQRNGHAVPTEHASQGSYAMKTMHQDEQTDYDIDDAAYFEANDLRDANGYELSPYAARKRVCDALQQDERLKYPAEIKDNCVRQRYPEGYHIDVPVYRIIRRVGGNGVEVTVYEHASADVWTESDARRVTDWFNGYVGQLNSGQPDGSQLRRVTRLTKKQARSRIAWKARTTSGISMTKLVVDHFVASPGRDDEALRETWKAIHSKLNVSQRIRHPVLAQNLADEGDGQVVYFRDRLGEALDALVVLEAATCTRTQARGAWDRVFNTTYFSSQPTDDETKGHVPFIVTSDEVARRNDGDRRFG